MFGVVLPPEEDETVSSWLARINRDQDRTETSVKAGRPAIRNPAPVIRAAFDGMHKNVNHDFPLGLSRLASNCPGTPWSVDYLVDHHTVFPYYSRFIGQERHQRLREVLTGRRTVGKQFSSQIMMTSRIHRPIHLRYCRECVAEDTASRPRVGTWRRVHQMPGVYVCPDHHALLFTSNVPCRSLRSLVCCPGDPPHAPPAELNFTTDLAIRLAEDARWLLSNPGPSMVEALKPTLDRVLVETGTAVSGGRMTSALYKAMLRKFGEAGLHGLGVSQKDPRRELWSHHTASKPEVSFSPLHWSIAAITLDLTLAELLNKAAGHEKERGGLPGQDRSRRTVAMPAPRPKAKRAESNPEGTGRKLGDEALVRLLTAAAEREFDPGTWPRRITVGSLFNAIGQSWPLDRLQRRHPQAAALLNSLLETSDQARARCLIHVARQALMMESCPDWTRFKHRAAFRPKLHGPIVPFAKGVHTALLAAAASTTSEEALEDFDRMLHGCLDLLPPGSDVRERLIRNGIVRHPPPGSQEDRERTAVPGPGAL